MNPESVPKSSPDSASLVQRLAGPSVTKAGLAHDQSEINRIIAEVSKGSKFYENEKRKDKELTERIQKILQIRDNFMRHADVASIEADVDKLITELESQRDLSQSIVHVDMDAFYANVELMYNPDLKDKPFGVGKGVLTTASYEARKYGVRSGMAGFVAKRLCPDLIFVPLNFSRYSEMSKKVMCIFRQYDPNMLVAGCDEGYLNITNYCQEHDITAEACVSEMRQRVFSETKLTVSAGIAPNKMLAKICSDKNKPNGQFFLSPDSETIHSFMKLLPIRKLPGVGRVNERVLDSIGVKTCGDIYTYRATISLMDKCFGMHYLLSAYLGISSNVVQPYLREERKSISAERTFSPIDDQLLILEKLDEVATELEKDMEDGGWVGKTVTLKYKLDTYQVFTRAKSFDRWISKKADLYNIGKDILKSEFPLRIRLIGLRVNKLKDLRIKEDKGIKRFFEAGAASPNKKRKVTHDPIEIADDDDDGHEDDSVMPGYDDEDAWDDALDNDDEVDDLSEEAQDLKKEEIKEKPTEASFVPSTSRPIISALATSSSNKFVSIKATKCPRVTQKSKKDRNKKDRNQDQDQNHDRNSAIDTSTGTISNTDVGSTRYVKKENCICPICSKEFYMDNVSLNAHIDFCLSKGAIMRATGVESFFDDKKRKMKE